MRLGHRLTQVGDHREWIAGGPREDERGIQAESHPSGFGLVHRHERLGARLGAGEAPVLDVSHHANHFPRAVVAAYLETLSDGGLTAEDLARERLVDHENARAAGVRREQ